MPRLKQVQTFFYSGSRPGWVSIRVDKIDALETVLSDDGDGKILRIYALGRSWDFDLNESAEKFAEGWSDD